MRVNMLLLRAGVAVLLAGAAISTQARKRDPLNPLEIDQLRETAQEPEKRLKLYSEFALVRLNAIEAVRAGKDPDAADATKPTDKKPEPLSEEQRMQKVHDLLEDFLAIYDELEENISTYDDRKADLRKALKHVISGDTEMKMKLAALRHNLTPAETVQCEFVMRNAIEAVSSGLEDHQKLLVEHEANWKDKKKQVGGER